MRGRRAPVSSRYSDIGHHHITRDPGIPDPPDLASGKLSSSWLSSTVFFCMAMIFLVIRWYHDASLEGTIKWQNKNFSTAWQRDAVVLDLRSISGCWFWFCPQSLGYKWWQRGREVSEAWARQGGGTLTITITTPEISDMVMLTVDARVLMVNVVTEPAFMSRY